MESSVSHKTLSFLKRQQHFTGWWLFAHLSAMFKLTSGFFFFPTSPFTKPKHAFLSQPRTWCRVKSTDKDAPTTHSTACPTIPRTPCGRTRADALSSPRHGWGEQLPTAPAAGQCRLRHLRPPLPARRAGRGGEALQILGRRRLCPGGVWAEQSSLVDPGSSGPCLQQRFPDFPGSCAGACRIDRRG